MLKRELRINKSGDYKLVYEKGKKFSGRYIIVYIKENNLGHNRFGFVVSKKIGNAVVRNRIKRQLRAIINEEKNRIKGSFDIVIICRHNLEGYTFSLLHKDVMKIFKKAGLN
ncbi:ribonuclease P protein component [Thermosyntropha lipolytica DSM 11003]|uniref:Ribonuclease P protein component n=1 Tax=Thermosyntropha lipolytica DSM 11003 TaxID=1123382 RepID=A0A1M5QQU2_9FIRM|nr:ribonuclease P protein component [Thermosyntropha lipolytica]SHH16326.1 ribonuclease P protein component [Thermosyntropha lipolytica DSM 11003]